MALSKKQVEDYQRDGYTCLPNLFSPREVTAMQAEVDRLMEDGLLRNVAVHEEDHAQGKDAKNLQICPLSPHSMLFRALPYEETVIDKVRQCIGESFVLHLDQIFLKPGHSGRGTSWHQDNAYFRVEDPTFGVGMWIAIHDATVANGTLHVVPSSYRNAIEHERDPGSDHHIRCQMDESKAVAVDLPAGSAILFNFGVPHCTKANTTDAARAGLALHFLHTDHIPSHAGRGGERITSVLRGPDATDGETEYGSVVRGTWSREIDRVLRERTSPVAG